MKRERLELLEHVESLVASGSHDHAALREALEMLRELYREQDEQVERLIRISDRYQRLLQEREDAIRDLYRTTRRREEKVSRISDLYQRLMQETHASLSEAATHDPLTGLPNRRLIHQRLAEEAERARRGSRPFALAMLDVDRFKPINDQYGHTTGDRLLVAIAEAMRGEIREYDLCGRWGGEEFLLLLAGTDVDTARSIVERMRRNVAALTLPVEQGEIGVTISAGLTAHESPEPPEATINRADEALYQAKHGGRDACCVK